MTETVDGLTPAEWVGDHSLYLVVDGDRYLSHRVRQDGSLVATWPTDDLSDAEIVQE